MILCVTFYGDHVLYDVPAWNNILSESFLKLRTNAPHYNILKTHLYSHASLPRLISEHTLRVPESQDLWGNEQKTSI